MICDVCGLPDPYRGRGDGGGSCDCPPFDRGEARGSSLCICPLDDDYPYDVDDAQFDEADCNCHRRPIETVNATSEVAA